MAHDKATTMWRQRLKRTRRAFICGPPQDADPGHGRASPQLRPNYASLGIGQPRSADTRLQAGTLAGKVVLSPRAIEKIFYLLQNCNIISTKSVSRARPTAVLALERESHDECSRET